MTKSFDAWIKELRDRKEFPLHIPFEKQNDYLIITKNNWDTMLDLLCKYRKALSFYGERMNYSLDDFTSQYVARRVILYSDQEEINEETIFAGKRAREALSYEPFNEINKEK